MKITTCICLAIVASALVGQWAAAGNPKLSSHPNKRPQTQQERKELQQPLDQSGADIREEVSTTTRSSAKRD
jgi:hypothetical protein